MAATANIKLVGTSSLVEANTNGDQALFMEARVPALNGYGVYSLAASSGSIAATLAANAAVFSMRWTSPNALCLVRRVSMNLLILSTVTSAVRSNWVMRGLHDFATPDSAQTAISLNTLQDDQKFRRDQPPSQFQIGDVRISSTGAITAGSRVRDANMLAYVTGNIGASAPLGTWILGNGPGLYPIFDRTGPGDQPLVLNRFEGFAIENEVTGPASGTFCVVVQVEWQEGTSY